MKHSAKHIETALKAVTIFTCIAISWTVTPAAHADTPLIAIGTIVPGGGQTYDDGDQPISAQATISSSDGYMARGVIKLSKFNANLYVVDSVSVNHMGNGISTPVNYSGRATLEPSKKYQTSNYTVTAYTYLGQDAQGNAIYQYVTEKSSSDAFKVGKTLAEDPDPEGPQTGP